MKFFKFFFLLILITGSSLQVRASITDGTIDSVNNTALLCANDTCTTTTKINFLTTNGTDVHITDSAMTGKAWSEKMGWINLNPTHGGVTNTINGVLGGYAWGENTGWINFAPTHGGVSINTSGEFTGWAWAQNAGWIKFDCNVSNACLETDWRPFSVRPTGGGGGGGRLLLPAPIPEQVPPIIPIKEVNLPVDVLPPIVPVIQKEIKKTIQKGIVALPKGNIPSMANNFNKNINTKIQNKTHLVQSSNISKTYQNTKNIIINSLKNTTKTITNSIQNITKIVNKSIITTFDSVYIEINHVFDFFASLFK